MRQNDVFKINTVITLCGFVIISVMGLLMFFDLLKLQSDMRSNAIQECVDRTGYTEKYCEYLSK